MSAHLCGQVIMYVLQSQEQVLLLTVLLSRRKTKEVLKKYSVLGCRMQNL